jgi:hypothetical protein
VTRNVLVLIFEPRNPETSEFLWQDRGYNNPVDLAQAALEWWAVKGNGKLRYQIVETIKLEQFPRLNDGFVYDYASWSAVMANPETSHQPDIADYERIIADTDLCTKLNAGSVHELWMFGGPYFGFAESALAGPGAFSYNGPSFADNACQKLVPIMGFNYERGRPEMLHNWGHRAEATMTHVFGGWQQDRMSHDWDRFGLTAAQSPSFGYSGCGSIHYPPNATQEYAYDQTLSQQTFCRAFENYPDLPADPATALEPVDCNAWSCTEEGYLGFWFSFFPSASGVKDGIYNDWWRYFIDPNLARDCSTFTSESACAEIPRCQWACDGCFRSGVGTTAACSPCGLERTLEGCDAHGGCAWYSCGPGFLSCWPQGTPPDTACAG